MWVSLSMLGRRDVDILGKIDLSNELEDRERRHQIFERAGGYLGMGPKETLEEMSCVF